MDDVKWIKFKVGTFDGMSFKKIKRAKIDGVMNFRDKLTAVWFELLDLGGKVNNNGFLINDELAFVTYEDIAIALDRTEDEIKMCLNWFTQNNMMEIIDNIYLISNWSKYQNVEGLEKIREQNRLRQQKFRHKKASKMIGTGLENQNCVYCGSVAKEIDHIIPQSRGGSSELENLVPCCRDCNMSKTNRDVDVFLNERFRKEGMDLVDKIMKNDKLRNVVCFDYNKQKFKLSHDSNKSNVTPLKDNNISLSNSELSNTNNIKEDKNKRFIKPTLEEVKEYVKEKGKNVDAETFWNFYESKNWYVGKNKMTNWHSAIATWNKPSKTIHQKPTNLTKAQFDELEQITRNKTSKMFGGIK